MPKTLTISFCNKSWFSFKSLSLFIIYLRFDFTITCFRLGENGGEKNNCYIINYFFIYHGGLRAFQPNFNIIAKGNIAQKSRVVQSWRSTDKTDFHFGYYKENIVSATFLDNNNVPSNVVESWNVSGDKKHGI